MRDEDSEPTHHNEISGRSRGMTVQAATVNGGIHYNADTLSRKLWRWGALAAVLVVAPIVVVIVVQTTSAEPDRPVGDARGLHVNEISGRSTRNAYEFSWVTDTDVTAEQVAGARTRQDIPRLMETTAGLRVGQTDAEVVLEGVSDKSVLIRAIKARIVKTGDAVAGTIVTPPAAGGPVPRTKLAFDLDEPEPQARVLDGRGGLGPRFTDDNDFKVEPGEKYVFLFYGVAKTARMYHWVIDLEVLVGDRRHTLTLGEGDPLRVTGPVATYRRYFRNSDAGLIQINAREVCPTGDCRDNADEWSQVR